MLKNKSLLLLLTLLTHTTTYNKNISSSFAKASTDTTTDKQTEHITTAPQRLSEYDFGSGSVLPFITNRKGKRYFILSREAYGKVKGTYDDFGGSRDPGENHPVITAGREFFEEAVIQASTGLSLLDTYGFIDIAQTQNTEYIIAFSRNVAYLTDFTKHADKFFTNFYVARKTMTDFHFKEKDRLALVEWELLAKTIKNAKSNKGVVIKASVLDPQDQQWKTEQITLRDFFVIKFKPFFMNKPYKQGMNKKIRFYDATTKPEPTEQQPSNVSQKSWSTRFWDWLRS